MLGEIPLTQTALAVARMSRKREPVPPKFRPRRFVRTFRARFARKVEQWEKRQTVRATPVRMPLVGDIFDAREWLGRPYASKQRRLVVGRITRVEPVRMWLGVAVPYLEVNHCIQSPESEEAFARADGFDSVQEFYDWFTEAHGMPFEGIVVHWEKEDGLE